MIGALGSTAYISFPPSLSLSLVLFLLLLAFPSYTYTHTHTYNARHIFVSLGCFLSPSFLYLFSSCLLFVGLILAQWTIDYHCGCGILSLCP